uniref:Uncharacterized protein n=1 Tax=Pararge aegeria TaxID=116150 RepID=S4PTA3_9NEOP
MIGVHKGFLLFVCCDNNDIPCIRIRILLFMWKSPPFLVNTIKQYYIRPWRCAIKKQLFYLIIIIITVFQ